MHDTIIMALSNSASPAPSRDQTPNPNASKFAASRATAEDLLRSQTEGLVSLSDYRKRRREAWEQGESGISSAAPSGATTPKEGYVEFLLDIA